MKKVKLLGFTLIEVLIAVIILASSTVLILGIINNTQRLRTTAYTKTIATMLSKEGIEIFLNMRNSNIMDNGRDLDWNCTKVNSDGGCESNDKIDTTKYYTISINNGGYELIADGDKNIYICNGIYTQTNSAGCTPTKDNLQRYIKFENYQGSNQAYKIQSTVSYNRNGYTGSVVLNSVIGNIGYIKKKSE